MKWLAGGAFVLACTFLDLHSGGTGKWLPVCLLAAVLLFTGKWKLTRAHEAGILLFGWACVSLLWSEDWRQGLHQVGLGFALLVIFLRSGALKESVGPAVMLAVAGVLVLACFDDDAGFGNPIFVAEFLLIAAPFLFLTQSVGLTVGIVAATWLLVFNRADIEVMALALVAFGVARTGKLGRIAFVVACVAAVLAVALSASLRVSLLYRVELIWNSLELWIQAPFFGHGFGSFNAIYPLVQEQHVVMRLMDAPHMLAGAVHNEPVQLLVELGVIGFLIALYGLWLVVWPRTDPVERAASWSLGMTGILALVEFPLQNPATGLLAAVSLGILAGGEVMYRPRMPVWAASVAALLLVWIGFSAFTGADHLGRAMRMAERGHWSSALQWNAQAALVSNSYDIRLQLPMTLDGLLSQYPQAIPPDMADRIHDKSLKNHPGVRLARLRYLRATGRNPEEQAEIIAALRREQPGASHMALQRILRED